MARGDVLLIDLPVSGIGREQEGRRPAIAVQVDNPRQPMLMVVPVTSALTALRFDFAIRIEPSAENGLTLPSIAMIFQMRAIDKNRIVRKLGRLSQSDLDRLFAEIQRMLKS